MAKTTSYRTKTKPKAGTTTSSRAKAASRPKTAKKTITSTTRKTTKVSPETIYKNLKISQPLTKSELMSLIAETTGTSRQTVNYIFDVYEQIVTKSLKNYKEFTFPGVMKLVLKRKPATKARKGINPFTQEMTTFKAKPASNKIIGRFFKKLKDNVQ